MNDSPRRPAPDRCAGWTSRRLLTTTMGPTGVTYDCQLSLPVLRRHHLPVCTLTSVILRGVGGAVDEGRVGGGKAKAYHIQQPEGQWTSVPSMLLTQHTGPGSARDATCGRTLLMKICPRVQNGSPAGMKSR